MQTFICARISLRMMRERSFCAAARLSALREEIALPTSERGPVAFSHGCQRLIASACFARRSGVHALRVPTKSLISSFGDCP